MAHLPHIPDLPSEVGPDERDNSEVPQVSQAELSPSARIGGIRAARNRPMLCGPPGFGKVASPSVRA